MAPMKRLVSRNKKGQYRKVDYQRVKTIKGKRYDRTILKAADIAVKGAGDGRISQKDAKMICRACRPTTDGRSTYDKMEKDTMAYVRKTYKCLVGAEKDHLVGWRGSRRRGTLRCAALSPRWVRSKVLAPRR